MHGIEKSDKNLNLMKSCPQSYGILCNNTHPASKHTSKDCYANSSTDMPMSNGQLIWIIRKGDLLFSNKRKVVEEMFQFAFIETDSRKFKLCVYEYPDIDLPDRFETAKEGRQH
jgi:hypothetical protein